MELGDLQGFLNKMISQLKEIARHTRCMECDGGSGGTNVVVTNTVADPVIVTIVPSAGGAVIQTTSAGTGTIPAGFKSISIVKTSTNIDSVTITLSDSSVYTMTEQGEVFVDAASEGNTLPTYIIAGAGIIKWHGVK